MNFFLHVLATIGFTLPHALGYNVVFGRGKIFHFGPVGVSLATAYTVFVTQGATGSLFAGIAAGAVMAAVLSLFFSWLALRLDPDGLGVLTIAAHLMLLTIVLNAQSLTRGALGIPGIPRPEFLQGLGAFAFVALAISAVWAGVLWRLDRGPFGRQLAALAEHAWHAQAVGIDRWRVQTAAFLLAGFGALLSAVLFPLYLGLLHPNDYRFDGFMFFATAVIAGGSGSVRGVVLSTALLVTLKECLRLLPLPLLLIGPLRLAIFGAVLFIAIALRRETLFPPVRSV